MKSYEKDGLEFGILHESCTPIGKRPEVPHRQYSTHCTSRRLATTLFALDFSHTRALRARGFDSYDVD